MPISLGQQAHLRLFNYFGRHGRVPVWDFIRSDLKLTYLAFENHGKTQHKDDVNKVGPELIAINSKWS